MFLNMFAAVWIIPRNIVSLQANPGRDKEWEAGKEPVESHLLVRSEGNRRCFEVKDTSIPFEKFKCL